MHHVRFCFIYLKCTINSNQKNYITRTMSTAQSRQEIRIYFCDLNLHNANHCLFIFQLRFLQIHEKHVVSKQIAINRTVRLFELLIFEKLNNEWNIYYNIKDLYTTLCTQSILHTFDWDNVDFVNIKNTFSDNSSFVVHLFEVRCKTCKHIADPALCNNITLCAKSEVSILWQ